MIRGLITTNRNLHILEKKQENLSTSVANLNTAGYKEQEIIQSTLLKQNLFNRLNGPELNQQLEVGGLPLGNQIDEVYRDFSQGGIQLTNSSTDLAIQGDAFFTVETGAGEVMYTRNGNFTVDAEGFLATQDGNRVLSTTNDPIQVGSMDFTVSNNGTVIETGQQLQLTTFADPAGLTSTGDTLFAGNGGVMTGDSVVLQSAIEGANTNTADVMVDLMQISREFEANQKILQAADQTLQKAVNELGKV
ncbi:flagellar hook-basal body protein [Desemzia sp. FAM 23989]|uniref:flagellar hook-basal body protein n=1 Tax=Desemzia sp. FAM 23989 TaxID=3259523 RepID=UPI0038864987